MNKILQATSRGQVTLPKEWRGKFETHYYLAEMNGTEITLRPLVPKTPTLEESVEQAWAEYQAGDFISHEDLIKKYGL